MLRKAVLDERLALTASEVKEKSRIIAGRVLTMTELLQADTVMAYADFRNEVETGRLIVQCMQLGKRVVMPLTVPPERKLRPSLILNYPDDLQPGNWGIPEPKPHLLRPVEPEEIDVVFVPGVAFDPAGNRLGYGGGYYDRFLPGLKAKAIFIALAYECQVRCNIVPDTHDIPVHYIITENRTISCAN